MVRHVKFYSCNDLSIAFNLDIAMEYLKKNEMRDDCENINDALELYSINKLVKCGKYRPEWSEDEKLFITLSTKNIPSLLGRYVNKIDDDNIEQIVTEIHDCYLGEFIELFNHYRLYEKISPAAFSNIVEKDIFYLSIILQHKKIVSSYDDVLANYVIEKNDEAAELLLKQLLADEEKKMKYYFPKSLSTEDKKEIIIEYMYSDNCNPNYLKLILESFDQEGGLIDSEIRLNAKRRFEKWFEKNTSNQSGYPIGAEIFFDNCDEFMRVDKTEKIPKYIYDKKWIEDNLDYPTLLQNFITIFEFADYQARLLPISYNSEMSAIEKHLGIKGKDEYRHGWSFTFKDILSTLQMIGYAKLLEKNGVRIEEVFSWFFSDYLNSEFGVEGFRFQVPSASSSYRERFRDIVAEMDGVLKQYQLYAKHKVIDRDLLELSSSTPTFTELKSMRSNKYGYSSSEELDEIVRLLFSDQAHLGYTKRTKDKYNTLANALYEETFLLEDYEIFQKPSIIWLIDKGVIEESEGRIRLNLSRVPIYSNLYYREVICIDYFEGFPYLQELIQSGQIITESTLFSRPEQKYLNYMMNKKEFSNGKDLRNRYVHGSNTLSEDAQQRDYYELLKMVAMIIIKINEEFCQMR